VHARRRKARSVHVLDAVAGRLGVREHALRRLAVLRPQEPEVVAERRALRREREHHVRLGVERAVAVGLERTDRRRVRVGEVLHDHEVGAVGEVGGAPHPVERIRDRGPRRAGRHAGRERHAVPAPGEQVAAHEQPRTHEAAPRGPDSAARRHRVLACGGDELRGDGDGGPPVAVRDRVARGEVRGRGGVERPEVSARGEHRPARGHRVPVRSVQEADPVAERELVARRLRPRAMTLVRGGQPVQEARSAAFRHGRRTYSARTTAASNLPPG
jgi:hypothetical protein